MEKITVIRGKCEDCGFYNDCPAEYKCPALETLIKVIKWMDEHLEAEE